MSKQQPETSEHDVLLEIRDLLLVNVDKAIWNYSDIGKYLKCAPDTARKIAQRPDFPPHCHVGRGKYHARMVIDWATGGGQVKF